MNKETQKKIDITPHKSLLVKVGQTGYSLQEALAELIDNSIDARLEGEFLEVEIQMSAKSIMVVDNGVGMSEEEATKSIRLGFSSKQGQLGEFGMGLKTSSTFMGKRFTIITTKRGDENEYVLTFDEEEWLEGGSWIEYPFTIKHGIPSAQSGTTIIVEKLKIEINESVTEKVKKELSARFAPFINNGELRLIINREEVKVSEPNLLDGRHEFSLDAGGATAKGWWGYQLRGLNKSYFGFNTFRRGRLVTTYDKIGLNPNQDVKQIIGNVDIEGVPISHDKKDWQKGTPEYKKVEEALRNYFAEFEPKPKKILSGYPASSGIVEGEIKRLNMFMGSNIEEEMRKINKGDILVTEMTRPQFLLAIRRSGAIITDLGGNLCHAAIVAREFGIPAAVGTQTATKVLKDGQRVIVDGNQGIVYES